MGNCVPAQSVNSAAIAAEVHALRFGDSILSAFFSIRPSICSAEPTSRLAQPGNAADPKRQTGIDSRPRWRRLLWRVGRDPARERRQLFLILVLRASAIRAVFRRVCLRGAAFAGRSPRLCFVPMGSGLGFDAAGAAYGKEPPMGGGAGGRISGGATSIHCATAASERHLDHKA